MNHDYTQLINDQYFSPTALELKRISEDVMCMPLDTDVRTWQEKLERIAQEFCFSCRFCLMRIFQSRARKLGQCLENGFWLKVKDKKFEFWDIDMDHAREMRDSESKKYLAYMRALARMQEHSQEAEELDIPERRTTTRAYENNLIAKAWAHRTVGKAEFVLSRQEAFRLGQILAFDRSEMEFFLMRVFDCEEGFRFDTANDLIEAYALQKEQKSWLEVEKLKRDHAENTQDVEKKELDGRNEDWTVSNARALSDGYASDADFLKWLKALAPGLDTVSRTARRIYRNVAVECVTLWEGDSAEKPELEELVTDLLECSTETPQARERLFDNGAPSMEKCTDLANRLRRINYEMASGTGSGQFYKDPTQKLWHIPTVTNKMSKLSTSDGPINASLRIRDLLYGETRVEKSDLLFLLWVLANQLWDQTSMEAADVTLRLQEFQEVCDVCLKRALLPGFYVPHLLEQTMLLAIVCNDTESYTSRPAREYEKILKLTTLTTRERKAGYHRHTEEEWLELVKLSRKCLEYSKTEFALWQGVSEQSLTSYERKFMRKGILPPFDRKKKMKQYREKLQQTGQLEAVMAQRLKNLEAAARREDEEQQQWREMQAKYEANED